MRFVAFVHKEPGSCFGVSFPDVPGCFSAGDTADEAVVNAVEALAGHVRMLREDGQSEPRARNLDDLLADETLSEERAGATIVFVPLLLDRGSTKRVNLSLDSGLVEAIDEAARERGMTRSAFVASAVRNEIVG
jgi:predicted RNase H-like HicB family nuclease